MNRLIIVILALCAYLPAARVPFMLDDPFLVASNPAVQTWSPGALKRDFLRPVYPDGTVPYYRPLQAVYLRSLYFFFGLRPVPYHLANLFFHAANGLLVYQLGLALTLTPLAALLGAGLFAVHPLAVHEMMAATQTDLIGLFLLLLVLLLSLRRGLASLLGATAAFVAALFWKESSVAAPLLVAWTLLAAGRRDARSYARLVPLLVLCAPYLLLRAYATQGMAFPTVSQLLRFSVEMAPRAMLHYGRVLFLPWNLQSWPPLFAPSPLWPLYLAAIAALAGACWALRKHWFFFAFGWFMLALLPRIPAMLMNGVLMDHWMYVSSVGAFLAIGHALAAGWLSSTPPMVYACRGCFMAALIAGAGLARWNLAVRGSEEKNLRWTLRFYRPTFAEYRLGILLLNSGRAKEALPYLSGLYRDFPQNASFQNAYALALWHTDHRAPALELEKALVRDHPQDRIARENLNWMSGQ